MFTHFRKIAVAAGAAATIATGALIPRPASADETSTLLTAAAAIIGSIIYENIQQKNAAANSIVGYTSNGGTVYGDGRVVMPNGVSYYPNSNGGYSYNSGYNGGYYNNNNGYNNGYATRGYANRGSYGGDDKPVYNANNRWNGNTNGGTVNTGRWNGGNRNVSQPANRDNRGH